MTPDTTVKATGPSTGTPSGTEIRLDHVTKDYGLAAPAVDDISLTIEPGEFMTLLGPSGSGKTTTLNLIAGFETLTAGSIALNGTDVERRAAAPAQPRHAVPELRAVPAHDGRAERRLPAARAQGRRSGRSPGRSRRCSSWCSSPGATTTTPSQLSGGQQQRVALARAIVFEPEALLLDEPLGALDRNLRAALQMEIRRIHREVGSTFVFVTHDQEEAMNLSDRIALFNNGRIEQVGTPAAAVRRARDPVHGEVPRRFQRVRARAGRPRRERRVGRRELGHRSRAPSPPIPACARAARSWCGPRTSRSRAAATTCPPAPTPYGRPSATSSTWARTARCCSPWANAGCPAVPASARSRGTAPSATTSWPGGGRRRSGSSRPDRGRSGHPALCSDRELVAAFCVQIRTMLSETPVRGRLCRLMFAYRGYAVAW